MRKISTRTALLALATAAVALALGGGVAQAGGGATLSLQVFPSSLLTGGSGAIRATFANSGHSTLTHVIVDVDLAGATFAAGSSSPDCTGTPSGASCSLGNVYSGQTVVETIAFTNTPSGNTGDTVTFDGTATWDSKTAGKPKGAPNPAHSTSGSGSATLLSTGDLAAANSSCAPGGDTLGASANGQSIDVTAGDNTLGLTCTPITTGIDDSASSVFFTKLPPLEAPATVVLTFTDENLPWPVDAFGTPVPANHDASAGYALYEYPDYPSTGTKVTVPPCNADGSLPSSPGPGVSSDSCVYLVASTDENEETGDYDSDMGTITLHVQGSATGDPGWPGVG